MTRYATIVSFLAVNLVTEEKRNKHIHFDVDVKNLSPGYHIAACRCPTFIIASTFGRGQDSRLEAREKYKDLRGELSSAQSLRTASAKMPTTALSSKVSGLKFMQRATAAKTNQQEQQQQRQPQRPNGANAPSSGATRQTEGSGPSTATSSPAQQVQAASSKTSGDAEGEEWTLPDSVTGRNYIPAPEDGIVFDPYWRDWTAPVAASSASEPSSSSGLRKSFANGAEKKQKEARKAPASEGSEEEDGDSSRGARSSGKPARDNNKRKAPQTISGSSSSNRGFMKPRGAGSSPKNGGSDRGGPSKKKARKS